MFTQLWYHVTIAHIISPRCFYPGAASGQRDRGSRAARSTGETAGGAPFHDVVRAGFGQRRKMLHKLLAPFGDVDNAFAAASVAPTARAEELAVEQWIRLANALAPGA